MSQMGHGNNLSFLSFYEMMPLQLAVKFCEVGNLETRNFLDLTNNFKKVWEDLI